MKPKFSNKTRNYPNGIIKTQLNCIKKNTKLKSKKQQQYERIWNKKEMDHPQAIENNISFDQMYS